LTQQDADSNAAQGRTVFLDARGCYAATDRQLVALYGGENLVLVATDDAVLAARRDHGDGLRRQPHKLKEVAPAVTRNISTSSTGAYQLIDAGKCFQVKRAVVKPSG